MIPVVGFLLGIVAGAMSVGSLWLIVRMTGRAARDLADLGSATPDEDLPSGWDVAPSHTRWDPEQAPPPRPTKTYDDSRSAIPATLRLLLAFILKAPLLILIARGAQTLGIVGVYGCVAGVVLVYCSAVFWAAGRTNRL